MLTFYARANNPMHPALAKLTFTLVALLLFAGAAQAHANTPEALSLPNSSGGYMRNMPVDGWQIGTFPVTEENERRYKWAIFDNGTVRLVYYKDEAPVSLVVGPDQNIWVADVGGGSSIDRFNPTTGELVKYTVRPWPVEIVVGPDGALWFASDWPAIGRITTSGELTEYELPPMTGPEKLRIGADGALEFQEHWANDIGHITLAGAYSKTRGIQHADQNRKPSAYHRHRGRRHRDR